MSDKLILELIAAIKAAIADGRGELTPKEFAPSSVGGEHRCGAQRREIAGACSRAERTAEDQS
jgi:hypothetical protein